MCKLGLGFWGVRVKITGRVLELGLGAAVIKFY